MQDDQQDSQPDQHQQKKQDKQQNNTVLSRMSTVWTEWISTLMVLGLLVLTLIIGTGEMLHGQLLRLGESLYGNQNTGMQYSVLRAEPVQPSCESNPNIDLLVQQQMTSNAQDEFASFFGAASEQDVRQSVLAAQQICQEKYQFYDQTIAHIKQHPTLALYRNIEIGFAVVFQFSTDYRGLLLVLMVVIAAITTSLKIHHIALRSPRSTLDYQVYAVFMTLGNALLASSAVSQYRSVLNSGVVTSLQSNLIYGLWITLFSSLAVMSLYQLFKPNPQAKAGGTLGMALLSVPLYAYMAVITGISFSFFMDYSMGQGIYLGQLVEFSGIFLNLALFIWAGMLLKQTLIVDKFLNVLRPWNLTPEILTWMILLAAALPTAYTGASGIFVIAAGAIIYKEVWNAGGRRQFALAAAAMSGSMGVVLRPCLLIVVVASLNKEVTTDLLYHYGLYVFLITSTLFLVVSLFFAEQKFRLAAADVALPQSCKGVLQVMPYVVIFMLVWLFYKYALDTKMDEFTAPIMMPIILLVMVLFEKLRHEHAPTAAVGHWDDSLSHHKSKAQSHISNHTQADEVSARVGFFKAIHTSSRETVGHIGALVILMALSVSVGGFLERVHLMDMFPLDIANIYWVLTLIVVLMIFVGMIMDPFGAVILISATVAPVAYQYGIDPVHFWMITLIGFELGYVSPPVALNHLLARQSIGDDEVIAADAEVRDQPFYRRYERWILPLIVMLPAMLIIAYIPYIFKLFHWY